MLTDLDKTVIRLSNMITALEQALAATRRDVDSKQQTILALEQQVKALVAAPTEERPI